MVYSNNMRQQTLINSYEENAQQFALSEKKRVEDFQILYPISLAISAVCFLLTLVAFVWSKNPNFQAVGIALSVFGFAMIVIDFFSKERASIYYEQILTFTQ